MEAVNAFFLDRLQRLDAFGQAHPQATRWGKRLVNIAIMLLIVYVIYHETT